MGATNSQSVNHRGTSVPILAKNSYDLHFHSAPSHLRQPRTALIRNMTKHRFEEWQASLKQLERYNEYL
jgi:hypothetical protein